MREESSHKEECCHKEDRDLSSDSEVRTRSKDIGSGLRSSRSHRSSSITRPTPWTSRTQDRHATLTQGGPGILAAPDYVTALTAGRFSKQTLACIASLRFDAGRAEQHYP